MTFINECHSTLCSIELNRHRKKDICSLHTLPFRKAQRTAETVRSLNQNPKVSLISDPPLVDSIKLRRTRAKFILGASIDIPSYQIPEDPRFLRGLPSRLVEMSPVVASQGLDHEGPYAEIIVPGYFPPGSIMVYETQLQQHDLSLDSFCTSGAWEAFGELDLVDLNVVLYRTDVEERDTTDGEFGAYHVSGLGTMVYCGLEGWMHPLRHIMRYNDLGHPLCAHLREGSWAFDYVHNRLSR